MPAGPGRLVLAGTPIGDPLDAPARLGRLLAGADVVAAEDTRRVRRLAAALGVTISGRLLSCHEHNEVARSAELVEAARAGATVVLVSDAGMPTVSDPGYRVVQAALAAGVAVTAVPGPSAVLTALAVSGLPSDRFCFEGFLPRRAGERDRTLSALADERRTMVFFEAPHRTEAALTAMASAFGPQRGAALARELTKTHEQVRRGTLGELVTSVRADPARGEVTLVVAGASPGPVDLAGLVPGVLAATDAGTRLKDAVRSEAARHDVPARALYDLVVAARRQDRASPAQGGR